jgi:branched-chain amino acid transport system ATP-binding protein
MLLEVDSITRRYGGILALDACSFRIAEGETIGLVGPNGSGKSTLLNVITGVTRPNAGEVRLAGRNLVDLKPYRIARLGVGRSFQTTRLFPSLSVRENVRLGARSPEAIERVPELLARFGIAGLAETGGEALSFGQRRLVELARTVLGNPRLMLLDEPFAGLSPAMADELKDHIRSLKSDGIAIVLIEHNLPIVTELCPRILVLHRGRVIADGTSGEVQSNPAVIDAYLGAPDAAAAA